MDGNLAALNQYLRDIDDKEAEWNRFGDEARDNVAHRLTTDDLSDTLESFIHQFANYIGIPNFREFERAMEKRDAYQAGLLMFDALDRYVDDLLETDPDVQSMVADEVADLADYERSYWCDEP